MHERRARPIRMGADGQTALPAVRLTCGAAREGSSGPMKRPDLSIVIPTFGREEVLLETLASLLRLPHTLLTVVDQTACHKSSTAEALDDLERSGAIQRIELPTPSIPRAMNLGALASPADIILFLDDDVIPSPDLTAAHLRAHQEHPEAWAVVGQVLQPGEEEVGPVAGEEFRFNSSRQAWIDRAMAGNLSVKKTRFLQVGGFDENFVMAAYCFETEFAGRVLAAGGRVLFEPAASIRHLQAARGGTRSHGHHLTTSSPAHSVGAYYHFFLQWGMLGAMVPSLRRLARSAATRHHLRHPLGIPATWMAEIRGWLLAVTLFRQGPKLLGIPTNKPAQ